MVNTQPDLGPSSKEGRRGLEARLRASRKLLMNYDRSLWEGLERAQQKCIPLTVQVEGYEHSSKITLALLNCAHAAGVTVIVVPIR